MARKEADSNTPSDPTPGLHITPVNIGGDSLVDRILPHLPKIAAVVGALVIVVAVVFGYRWYRHSQEAKSTTRLAKAIAVIEQPVKVPGDAAPAPATDEVTWPSYEARATAAVDAFAKVGDLRGAASLVEANQLVTAGRVDDAIAIFRKVGAGTGDDAVLAREGLGLALENKAASMTDAAAARQQFLEDALAAMRSAQPDDNGLRRDYTLYHEARLLETLGRPSEAIAPLQKALQVAPGSNLRQDIENKLAVLGGEPLPASPTP